MSTIQQGCWRRQVISTYQRSTSCGKLHGRHAPEISCLVACPAGVDLNDTGVATPATEIVWRGHTAPGGTTADKDYHVMGVFIADAEQNRTLFINIRSRPGFDGVY